MLCWYLDVWIMILHVEVLDLHDINKIYNFYYMPMWKKIT